MHDPVYYARSPWTTYLNTASFPLPCRRPPPRMAWLPPPCCGYPCEPAGHATTTPSPAHASWSRPRTPHHSAQRCGSQSCSGPPWHSAGFRVEGSQFRVQGPESRAQGPRYSAQCSVFSVQGVGHGESKGSGFRVWGMGNQIRAQGSGCGAWGIKPAPPCMTKMATV